MATLEDTCIKVYPCYLPIQTDFNFVQEAYQTREYIHIIYLYENHSTFKPNLAERCHLERTQKRLTNALLYFQRVNQRRQIRATPSSPGGGNFVNHVIRPPLQNRLELTIYERRVHTMLINATPFNDPFLVHPDVDLIAFSFPLSFSPPPPPPSLCRWRRPRLISNLLDGLVHSNFPSNVPDWSPQRESHLYTVHTRTRNNICSQKKFLFFPAIVGDIIYSSCSMERIPRFDCYCY